MGSLKNERLLIQVRCRSKRSSTDDYQMDGLAGLSWDFLPFLDAIPVGLTLEITDAN